MRIRLSLEMKNIKKSFFSIVFPSAKINVLCQCRLGLCSVLCIASSSIHIKKSKLKMTSSIKLAMIYFLPFLKKEYLTSFGHSKH